MRLLRLGWASSNGSLNPQHEENTKAPDNKGFGAHKMIERNERGSEQMFHESLRRPFASRAHLHPEVGPSLRDHRRRRRRQPRRRRRGQPELCRGREQPAEKRQPEKRLEPPGVAVRDPGVCFR